MDQVILRKRACQVLALLLLVSDGTAQATTWVVTGTGEPATLDSASGCDVATATCTTLRDAINSAESNDTIRFDSALDSATIVLTLYTNCLRTTDAASDTCLLPAGGWTNNYVHQFGPSAFFIAQGTTLTIDATADASGHAFAHGVTLQRSSAGGTPSFRLFDVDTGATLTLAGLRLSNGRAEGAHSYLGGGALGAGGAIFSQGDLSLSRCTLDGNTAHGGDSADASYPNSGAGVGNNSAGLYAGLYAGGPNGGVNGDHTSTQSGGFGGGSGYNFSGYAGGIGGFGGGGGGSSQNGGIGGFGGGGGRAGSGSTGPGGFGGGLGSGGSGGLGGGGAGMGGAIFNDAGTLTLTNVTFNGNQANGANGGANGGSGYGGAVFNYAGTTTLNFVTATGNSVGTSGGNGNADGGGIYSLGHWSCVAGGNVCPPRTAVLTVSASIVAANAGGTNDIVVNAIADSVSTSDGSGNYNAIGASAGFTASDAVATNGLNLGALHSAGGGLDAIMLPGAGSTAINAAPCGAVGADQLGVMRPDPASAALPTPCDIGAVEADSIFDAIFASGFDSPPSHR